MKPNQVIGILIDAEAIPGIENPRGPAGMGRVNTERLAETPKEFDGLASELAERLAAVDFDIIAHDEYEAPLAKKLQQQLRAGGRTVDRARARRHSVGSGNFELLLPKPDRDKLMNKRAVVVEAVLDGFLLSKTMVLRVRQAGGQVVAVVTFCNYGGFTAWELGASVPVIALSTVPA